MYLQTKQQIFQILLKLIYFQFTFSTENIGKWNDELSVRAVRFVDESIIEFDEFQDFYVSKFFDKCDGCFNCDVKIKFYDTKLDDVCYEKLYTNQWLYIKPIFELSASGDFKLMRVVSMESRKRENW